MYSELLWLAQAILTPGSSNLHTTCWSICMWAVMTMHHTPYIANSWTPTLSIETLFIEELDGGRIFLSWDVNLSSERKTNWITLSKIIPSTNDYILPSLNTAGPYFSYLFYYLTAVSGLRKYVTRIVPILLNLTLICMSSAPCHHKTLNTWKALHENTFHCMT